MNNSSQFTIDILQLRALASLSLATRSPLANLAPLSLAADTNISKESLQSAGLIDSEGQIAPYLRPYLRTINNANRVSQVFYLQSNEQISSNLVFYTPDQKSQGLQIDEQGQIQFFDESTLKEAVIQSIFNHQAPIESKTDYTITLASVDAFVFTTLIDMQRMEYLETSTSGATVFRQTLSAKKVADFIDQLILGFSESEEQEKHFTDIASSPNRRISFLLSMLISPQHLTLQDINTSFVRLAKAGWLVPFQVGYLPGNAIISISRDFLEVERAAFLEAHTKKNDFIESEEMLCIGMAGKYLTFYTDSEIENQIIVLNYASLSGANLLSKYFKPAPIISKRADPGVNQEIQPIINSSAQSPQPIHIQSEQAQEAVFPGDEKKPRSFWLALGLAMISLVIMCSGCGLAAWALTW